MRNIWKTRAPHRDKLCPYYLSLDGKPFAGCIMEPGHRMHHVWMTVDGEKPLTTKRNT